MFPNINNIDYINQKIYIPQYPEGNKLSVSEGKIIKINDSNELVYDASTEDGSSGSPIFLKNTTEVIGIHKEGNTHTRKENYGTLITVKLVLIPLLFIFGSINLLIIKYVFHILKILKINVQFLLH